MKSIRLHTRAAVTALVCTLSLAVVSAQDLAYSSRSDGSDGAFTIPDPFTAGLQGFTMAYDPDRGQTVLFGGAQSDANEAVAFDTMWTWDGSVFTEVNPASKPPARHSASMVWDDTRKEIVLFGGRNGATLFNDTWTWNGTTWTQKNPATSPTPRWNHAMAYDAPRSEIVLFGGGVGSAVNGETWTWNGVNWTQETPVDEPSIRFQHAMAYDPASQETLLFGGRAGSTISDETWLWDGTNWTLQTLGTKPVGVVGPALISDPVRQNVVLVGGSTQHREDRSIDQVFLWNGTTWNAFTDPVRPVARYFHAGAFDGQTQKVLLAGGIGLDNVNRNDVWTFDGATWESVTGNGFVFDMRDRPNGIWNFTTISIPQNVSVGFAPNAANTPVIWLATGNVDIGGDIELNGEDGVQNTGSAIGAVGGPGGFRGGIGGLATNAGGPAGQPGLGPGGGDAGSAQGQNAGNGQFTGAYGNLLVDPVVGGSGGGGGGGGTTTGGGGGGAGGGALLIASSLDITLDGAINALGGEGNFQNGDGGDGSGGAIVLVADRLLGSGTINADGPGGAGRVRLEAFERPLANNATPQPAIGVPFADRRFDNLGQLVVSSIAGQNLPALLTGDFTTPDITVSSLAPVPVIVTAVNVPDGVAVRLRVTAANGQVTNFPSGGDPDVTLDAGSATFNVTLPEGIGSIQAIAVVGN